jgi:4-amino-4-deoxy-L-arabinose transferase-like glycosyltransferase
VLACASLAFVFEAGRVLTGGVAGGVLAAAVAGVNLLLLRYGRSATTDVQLALWVAVANACLVKAWFENRPWVGAVGGGVAVGLAVMSKGPVALVQTVLPVAVAYAFTRWRGRRTDAADGGPAAPQQPPVRRLAPFALGAALALLVAVPWYAYVWSQNPDIVGQWRKEVTREGATDLPADAWYGYLTLPVLMLPWTIFFVAGAIATVRDAARGHARAAAAAALLIVPVLVMSLFRDKPDRYLLPLVGAAGVVCAWAMLGQLRPRPQRVAEDRLLAVLHGLLLVAVAVLPLGGALPAADWGLPWYGWPFAAAVAGAAVAAAAAGMFAARRWGGAAIAATVVVMLLVNLGFVRGYRNTFNGRAELKPVADRIWQVLPPDAEVLYLRPERPKPLPLDLNIYTNRLAREIDDLSRERPRRWPQAAVVLQRTDRVEPPPVAPTGWEAEGQFPAGERRTWHLFVRKPADPRG